MIILNLKKLKISIKIIVKDNLKVRQKVHLKKSIWIPPKIAKLAKVIIKEKLLN